MGCILVVGNHSVGLIVRKNTHFQFINGNLQLLSVQFFLPRNVCHGQMKRTEMEPMLGCHLRWSLLSPNRHRNGVVEEEVNWRRITMKFIG